MDFLNWLRPVWDLLKGAVLGLVVGLHVSAIAGGLAGGLAGWYNELTLSGHQYEELFIGFGEYSAYGMSVWSAFICGLYGTVTGTLSGAASGASRRTWVGLVVGFCVVLAITPWNCETQVVLVWMTGGSFGAICAALVGAKSSSPREPPLIRYAPVRSLSAIIANSRKG